MEPVSRIVGTGVPLRRSDIDTDQIIPAAWLKRIERTGFGPGLFSAWREDPDFVLNRPEHRLGTVLITGPNFGCGSSREHAVWALAESGFYAVISSRFADIFRANALKNGLLPVEIPQDAVETILAAVEQDPGAEIIIDVAERTITVATVDLQATFPLDDFSRYRLLNGLDDIALTLQRSQQIDRFETSRPEFKPSVQG